MAPVVAQKGAGHAPLRLPSRHHHEGAAQLRLRGLAGKPFPAPLTDIPVAAYLFTAVFDIISLAMGDGAAAQNSLFLVGTWLVVGAVGVSLPAAPTGRADWHRSSEPGNQARRTINAHAIIMLFVTAIGIANLIVCFTASWGDMSTAWTPMVLSVAAAVFFIWGCHLRRVTGIRLRLQH